MAEMTDLEIVKKCAEKMGMKPNGLATKSVAYKVSHCSILAINDRGGHTVYDPLHDDAQAMDLIKKFSIHVAPMPEENYYAVWIHGYDCKADNQDLNRAICECAARMP